MFKIGTLLKNVESMKRLALAAILVIALVLRLGIGVFLGFNSEPDMEACGSDTVEFEHMAWSAAKGNGLIAYEGGGPTAFRAPGYPLMLAGLYKLFGRQFWVNRLFLSLIGTGTCWLVYLMAVRMRMSCISALTAALITAVLPLQFYLCGHFMSDSPAGFLNVACCVLLAGALTSSGSGLWLLLAAGIINGVSCLVRPVSILVPFMLVFLLVCSRGYQLRKSIFILLVFLAGMTVVISPWVIRNKIVLDRFCLIASNGGSTFWGANNAVVAKPFADDWGRWITTNFDRERKNREVMILANEVDRDRKEWQIGKEFIRKNPGRVPVLLAGKFYRLLISVPKSANKIYVLIVGVVQFVLLPLTLLGMALILFGKDNRRLFIPVNAQLLTLMGTTAVFYGSERFRAAYEPFFAVYAAVGVVWIFQKIFSCCRERKEKEREFLDRITG